MTENIMGRIKQYLDFKGISNRQLELSTGMSNGSFSSQLKRNKTIGVDRLENILNTYGDINPEWLLTGKGSMLKTNNTSVALSISGNNNTQTGGSIVGRGEDNLQLKAEINELKRQLAEKDKTISNLIKQQEKLINKLTL